MVLKCSLKCHPNIKTKKKKSKQEATNIYFCSSIRAQQSNHTTFRKKCLYTCNCTNIVHKCSYLCFLSCYCNKHPEKSNLREDFIWLAIPGYSPSGQKSQNSKNIKQLITSTVKNRQQWINTAMLVLSLLSPLLDYPGYLPKEVPPTVTGSSYLNCLNYLPHTNLIQAIPNCDPSPGYSRCFVKLTKLTITVMRNLKSKNWPNSFGTVTLTHKHNKTKINFHKSCLSLGKLLSLPS